MTERLSDNKNVKMWQKAVFKFLETKFSEN